ncbi:MAG TPA: class I tRNA ligase family protein, partial [Flavilitoribacter sp.]|nr:class I tRNA ligase family protein [Flavilitoribacter sp.]
YTSVLADVFARLHRLLGIPTWALTGTDEHGMKVQKAAAARGVAPQQHVDEMALHFRKLIDDLGFPENLEPWQNSAAN